MSPTTAESHRIPQDASQEGAAGGGALTAGAALLLEANARQLGGAEGCYAMRFDPEDRMLSISMRHVEDLGAPAVEKLPETGRGRGSVSGMGRKDPVRRLPRGVQEEDPDPTLPPEAGSFGSESGPFVGGFLRRSLLPPAARSLEGLEECNGLERVAEGFGRARVPGGYGAEGRIAKMRAWQEKGLAELPAPPVGKDEELIGALLDDMRRATSTAVQDRGEEEEEEEGKEEEMAKEEGNHEPCTFNPQPLTLNP
ncbi:hypothetical protein T484DRAFT_1864586 [Baffinella frigidus]|nr:hypothetical protein T484DRAFT_1864586 [Cryptophyta sp. CCMP2293]